MELTVRQFAGVKRVAQTVAPLVAKKNKLINQIENLNKEIEVLKNQIDAHEYGVKMITGGYSTEDLITRVDNKFVVNENVINFDVDTNKYIIKSIAEIYPENTEESPLI